MTLLNVIQGIGKPKIVIGTTTISLPYCSLLEEFFTLDSIRDKLENGNISILKKGWYYRAELNYNRLSKEDLESLEPLSVLTNNNFMFYPRSDETGMWYYVELPEDFSLNIEQLKSKQGHQNVKIVFAGTKRLQKIKFWVRTFRKEETDIDVISESGDWIIEE